MFVDLSVKRRIAIVAILVSALFLEFSDPAWREARAAVPIVLSIGMWATGALPEWLTAAVFFTLCLVTGAVDGTVALGGFTSSATWLVISGATIGAAIRFTGLGTRLADRVVPFIGASGRRAILAAYGLGMVLTFAMPSAMARIVLLLPILRATAERLGFREGTRGRVGILIAGLAGTYMPSSTILPANVPNNVFVGTVEAALGAAPTYGDYFLLHFPVLGLVRSLLLIPLLLWWYRDDPEAPAARSGNDPRPITPPERRLAWLLLLAIALWATDGIHGVSPAWTGMVVACVCLFPGTGLMGERPLSSIGFESVFYVAAVVAVGALVDKSGLGGHIARVVMAALPFDPTRPALDFGLMSGLSTVVGLFSTLPGVPAVLTPLTRPLAEATGWSPAAVAMTQVIGYSTVLLPYQAPPLMVGIAIGGFPAREVTRLCLVTSAITILILWPMDYLWWVFLGRIG